MRPARVSEVIRHDSGAERFMLLPARQSPMRLDYPRQQFVHVPLLARACVADQRPLNSSAGRGVPAFKALMAEASPSFTSFVSNKGMAMLNITSSPAWTPPLAQARSKALWAAWARVGHARTLRRRHAPLQAARHRRRRS